MPCFAADRKNLWDVYGELLSLYPGWRMDDVRSLTRTERIYLMERAYWRLERSARG